MARVKTRQVMHLIDFGKEYKVIKLLNSAEEYPYRIYNCYYDYDGEDGRLAYHKKMVAKLQMLGDVFMWFMCHT